MRRPALLAVILGAIAIAACGQEESVSKAEEDAPVSDAKLFIQAAGMVKALGIT